VVDQKKSVSRDDKPAPLRLSSLTVEDVETFVLDHPAASIAAIARHFKVSANAIKRRLRYIPRFKSAAQRRDEYFKRLKEFIALHPTLTIAGIATVRGENIKKLQSYIWQHGEALGYVRKDRRVRKVEYLAKLKEFIARHPLLTMSEIAQARGEHPGAVKDFIGRHCQVLGYVKKRRSSKRHAYDFKVTAKEVKAAVRKNDWANNKELAIILSKPVLAAVLSNSRAVAERIADQIVSHGWANYVDKQHVRLTTYLGDIRDAVAAALGGQHAPAAIAALQKSQAASSTIAAYTREISAYRRKRPNQSPPVKFTTEEALDFWRKAEATQAEIARHFGVHPSTVSRRLAKVPGYDAKLFAKKSNKKVSAAQVEAFVQENPEATTKEAAAHFNCHVDTIRARIRELPEGVGFKPRMQVAKVADVAKFVRQHPEANQEEMARHFGVSKGTISNRLKHIPLYQRKHGSRALPLERRFSLARKLLEAETSEPRVFRVEEWISRLRASDTFSPDSTLFAFAHVVREVVGETISPSNDLYDDLVAEASLALLDAIREGVQRLEPTALSLEGFVRGRIRSFLKVELRRQSRRWGSLSLSQPLSPNTSTAWSEMLADPDNLSEAELIKNLDQGMRSMARKR